MQMLAFMGFVSIPDSVEVIEEDIFSFICIDHSNASETFYPSPSTDFG
jgi:hypothetical protein